MPKELIVSVNGREKKIAIVENGRVTEFYIERGEQSQGIVGNIYKGRVMRVLPGMQSAFVDIGLERDAFLYVSDFFDEEEEYERIVVDKKKTEGADDEAAQRAAAERIERQRVERERQMETAHETAEPAVAFVAEDDEDDAGREAAAPQRVAEQSEPSAETEEDEGGGRRRRRRRGRGEREEREESRGGGNVRAGQRISPEEIATPFVADASFERIVDDEAAAAEEGSMFKDARLQERLSDQTRAIEFDIDATTTAEVGSLLPRVRASSSEFQRIDDDGGEAGVRSVQREVAPSVAQLAGRFDDESEPGATLKAGQSFERVSDEGETETAAGAERSSRRKSAAKKGSAKKGSKKASAPGKESGEAESSDEKPKRAAKGAAKSSTKAASKKGAGKKAAAKSAGKRKKSDAGGALDASDREAAQESAAADADDAAYADADARVKAPSNRGEFARRGGRRRRRSGKPSEGGNGNGNGEEAEVVPEAVGEPEVEESEPVEAVAPPTQGGRGRHEETKRDEGRRDESRRDEGRRDGGRRDEGRRDEGRREERSREEGRREERSREEGRRDEGRREEGGNGRGGRGGGRERRERGGHPAITDLLREGQEIIVQIAKEPIAQKGARITSHIALPGRYLVYMPTVDHVGVSRKIESDQERSRLRKLIQKVVKEEDVPSGGFIVRTAGVGITEQDLRDDARYLVRTWRDIRRNAEKQKAAAIVHKDLDLVQRILRDQLSEDFTAIRIDSEEEYLEVVEFVNRIQPRLVNRVKLYTRDQPILEAYGVDAEIEKAIKPRVWLKSGGYLVINQTEALVAIDVNTGKFVGRGGSRLEDTITRTNLEAVDEIARQIRLRDLGGIIVLDLIDMEERRNRARVMSALQDALRHDKSPTKVLSFNDFGLVIMTRKRVKQSLERTLCSPCPYCTGSGLVKSPQTVCYEILEEARRLARSQERPKQTTLRVNPEVARALRSTERDVLTEIEVYLGNLDIDSDEHVHQEQFDFAFV